MDAASDAKVELQGSARAPLEGHPPERRRGDHRDQDVGDVFSFVDAHASLAVGSPLERRFQSTNGHANGRWQLDHVSKITVP
jgi:hypothetical protein